MSRILKLMCVALLTACAFAQADERSTKEAEVRNTLAAFIQAFDNLDWETFRASFADEATIFYPRAVPQRADGRSE
jgi:hypothetical protein